MSPPSPSRGLTAGSSAGGSCRSIGETKSGRIILFEERDYLEPVPFFDVSSMLTRRGDHIARLRRPIGVGYFRPVGFAFFAMLFDAKRARRRKFRAMDPAVEPREGG